MTQGTPVKYHFGRLHWDPLSLLPGAWPLGPSLTLMLICPLIFGIYIYIYHWKDFEEKKCNGIKIHPI